MSNNNEPSVYDKFGVFGSLVEFYDHLSRISYLVGHMWYCLLTFNIKHLIETYYWTLFFIVNKGNCVRRGKFSYKTLPKILVGLSTIIGLGYIISLVIKELLITFLKYN